ncbi:FxDxF family PEP-CTERM protein [Methylotetracoccus oryzae]|uniref:FxDxF family PEP-CTERM protein n=1 Tax=Methylotetracoccus oryzae TaxID=1919059 RepID=UPI001118558C|nr:FxDxF family PEP-CTERM protein [Methylotetracoccus oryzae]
MKQGLWKKAWIAAMLLGLTAPASAKVIQLGDLLAPSISGGESRYVVKQNTQGKFRNTFKFDLSKNADVNLTRSFGGGALGKHLKFSSVRMRLLDGDNNLIASTRGGRLASFAGALGEGSYQLVVAGKMKPGFARGAFKFSAGAIAAPVPEPEEWALMVMGAGLMAFQIRRKQRQLANAEPALAALPA